MYNNRNRAWEKKGKEENIQRITKVKLQLHLVYPLLIRKTEGPEREPAHLNFLT